MLLDEVMCLLVCAGQTQSVTYSAPFTFPWLETSTGDDASGVTFTAGKHGKYAQLNMLLSVLYLYVLLVGLVYPFLKRHVCTLFARLM